MVSAISVGVAARFTGTLSRKFALPSPLPVNRLSISVSTGVGATALTRTPLCAPSSAAVISPHAFETMFQGLAETFALSCEQAVPRTD